MKRTESSITVIRNAVKVYYEDHGRGSISHLAKIAEVRPETVGRFKKGETGLRPDSFERLADFLGAEGYLDRPQAKPTKVSDVALPYPAEKYIPEIMELRDTLVKLVDLIDKGVCTGATVAYLHGGLRHALETELPELRAAIEKDTPNNSDQ